MDNPKASIVNFVPSFGYVKESVSSFVEQVISYLKAYNINIEGKEKYVGVVFLFIGTNVYYWHKFSYWKRRNVKTPTPVPIFGNFLKLALNPRQIPELEWPRKYGRLYGYYVGTQPVLVCADANLLRKICIKDFNIFPNHFFLGVPNKYQKHILIFQKDDHWRGMRAILSPTFSSNKIRIMCKFFNQCCNDLVDNLNDLIEKDGSSKTIIEAKNTLGGFTIGSAVKSFYGIDLTSANTVVNESNLSIYSNTREGFAYMSRRVFQISFIRFMLSNILPWSVLKFFNYPIVGDKGMAVLANKADKIIEHRQKTGSNTKYNDYLQLLLDAKGDDLETVEGNKTDAYEDHHALVDNSKNNDFRPSKMKLTQMEVSCQVMMLMMVASETTSSFLSNTLYILSYHSEIQEKLYKELMAIKNSSETGDFSESYEQLTSSIYLDCVVSESLRLMPPALFMDRVAEEDYYVEEYNVTIPKGTTVNLSYIAIHRDPGYWSEPDKFNPDRFLPENKTNIVPGSYCPFGIGPRSCVGFRFALTEGKLALARLVTEFQFDPAPGTTWPPVLARETFLLNDIKNMHVCVRRRN